MLAYIGCRTTVERGARGEGLCVYHMTPDGTDWRRVQLLGDLVNPSFLAFGRDARHLYAVHGDGSEVSAFRVDPDDGTLAAIDRRSTAGKNPVHLAVDPTGRFLVVANHLTSTLAVLPIRGDGGLGDAVELHKLEGEPGPHRKEQPFSKPHQVEFDRSGRFIAVPDKGLDRTFVFRLADDGRLHGVSDFAAREGSGPRHVAFHRGNDFAWVVNELDSTVTSCRFDPVSGELTPHQILSALPDTFPGHSRASEIAVSADGRFVHASNRGHDSIATFAVDRSTGRLSPVAWRPTLGRTPRHFAELPGGGLVVANEDDDRIVLLSGPKPGDTAGSARIVARTGSPVCILFHPAFQPGRRAFQPRPSPESTRPAREWTW